MKDGNSKRLLIGRSETTGLLQRASGTRPLR
jgi:hypothetical protein